MRKSFLFIAAFLVLCASCRTGRTYKASSSQKVLPSEGNIVVFGELDNVNALADYMLGCDNFDNVDGSLNPDGLPDFSGEVISKVLAYPESQLDSFPSVYKACMDTVAFVSEGMELRAVRKSKGKYFVNPTDTLSSQIDSLAKECFRILRFKNAFTHKIAYPSTDSYVLMSDSDGNIVIIDSNVESISE